MVDTLPVQGRLAQSPTPFGPFLLLRRLGAGGMAETYLAERRARTSETGDVLLPFGRAVCLKLILPQHLAEPTFQGWFFDEARIHAHLHHDNIVQVYDFGELEGRAYLVLEYVEGCDLRALMNVLQGAGKLLPVRLVVAIAHELAAALDCAHQLKIGGVPQNLVHRDVSPHNVLMSIHGHAKLCDFGVVKAHSRVMQTETGGVKGKVPYMSPEQLSAPNTIDGRSDLFALGVVLFELLTGRHPFRVTGMETDMEVARRIFEGTRARVAELLPGAPAGLAALVEELLATDLRRRVPSAAQLMLMLEAQADAPTAATARELAEYVQAAQVGATPTSARLPGPRLPVLDEGTSWKRAGAAHAPAASSREATRSQPHHRPRARRPALRVLGISLTLALAVVVAAAAGLLVSPRFAKDADARAERTKDLPLPTLDRRTPPVTPTPSVTAGHLPVASSRVIASAPRDAARHDASTDRHDAAVQPVTDTVRHRGGADRGSRPHGVALRAPQVEEGSGEHLLNAWLDITVQPDGRNWRVWVDGQYQGTADVKVKVAAGKHLVAVGLEEPSRERSVRVAADAIRSLSFK